MSDTNISQHASTNAHGASNHQPALTAVQVFVDGGELGAMCRAKDWSVTHLGAVETWPQSLKALTNIVLNSAVPMIILWGEDLIQIYNDGYRLIMGMKHPAGLGQPSRECWPEVSKVIEPVYQRVLAGETISFEEECFQLAPRGYLEDVYLTLCYTPIRGDTGTIDGIFVTVFDVTSEVRSRTERDRALAEAEAERQRLYEVFMQTPAAVAVLEGPDHVFTVVNSLYLNLIGMRAIGGKTIRDAMPELEGQGFFELLDTVRATGESHSFHEQRVMLDLDGDNVLKDLYVNFVYQPLKNVAGRVFGIMVHAVDVTEQVVARRDIEQQAADLAQITGALERSNRELDQFAYVASHDLKAPLRGIANLASWIEEDLGETIDADTKKNLDLLRGRVTRMEALIEGILNYSRAGRHMNPPEQVDTGALVQEVVDLQALPSNVQVTVQPHMPTVVAERVPLQQIFMNLIGNAVKYTSAIRSDVLVDVGWSDKGDVFQFSIKDNGPGIDPHYHERIWGIFQTLEARDKVEGTGIGLAVVKKMIERAGGRVWVESALGEGATFFFTWLKSAKSP